MHAMSSFSDGEILSAKNALWESSNLKRQGNNKKRADFEDIVKAMKKLDSTNNKPLILATGKMLARTPNASGIPADANNSEIVQRISLLENSFNTFMKQQGEQLRCLSNIVTSIGKQVPNYTPSFLRTNNSVVASTVDLSSTPSKRKRYDEEVVTDERPLSTEQSGPSYCTAAKSALIQPNLPGVNRLVNSNNGNKQRRPSIMYGTSKTGKDDNVELLAADVALVAFGISKDASSDQLKQFVEDKGITVMDIEKLTRDDAETRTNTFKIVIKLSDYEKAMRPEIWPYRVGIRHYRPPKRQGLTWQQQLEKSRLNQVNSRQNQDTVRQTPGTSRHQLAPKPPPSRLPSVTLDVYNRYAPLIDLNGEVFEQN